MKDQPGIVLMGVLIKVIDPGGVETACSSLNPMHFVALLKQKLRKITAVLSRNTVIRAFFEELFEAWFTVGLLVLMPELESTGLISKFRHHVSALSCEAV